MGEWCSQQSCKEECDYGEVYCQKHLKEYDLDEAERQSEIRYEQAAADYLYGVKD